MEEKTTTTDTQPGPCGVHSRVSEQKINVTTIDNVRWHLRETKVVEGIRECEGGQGGSSCNKVLRKDLP